MIQTHICPDCQTFLVAADLTDMVLLRASHHCAAKQDRNRIHAFDVPILDELASEAVTRNVFTEYLWRDRITVEDARFLAAMKIDPL